MPGHGFASRRLAAAQRDVYAAPGSHARRTTVGDVSAARALARFVVGLSLDDVPPEVVSTASLLFLDTLGNALAAVPEDFGRAALRAAERLGGPPESTLIGSTARASAANAVLANGTLAHGLDFDDTREDAIVHTGSVAVTTALAVGEAVGASGREVLEALIAAVEVMCRVGLAVPGRFHARHFHPTALAGGFAAAAAAAKLRGLTEDQLVHAFGIGGSQAAGIIEYLTDGTWTKRLHPGWAAHAGIVAAVLSESGMIGPETVFEGPHGFFQAFAGGHDEARLRALLSTLGRTWEIASLTFKPYPCGSIAHPYMDCALRLRERHHIDVEQIVAIRCRTAEGPVPRLWEPLAAKHAPPNGYAAKFSLPYLIATMLVRGRAGLAEFSDAAVRDERVLRVAGRVSYELDPSIDYPRRFIGDVRVRLASGEELVERQEHSRGGPEHPVTPTEAETKFRGNAGLVLDRGRVDGLVARVGRLRDEPNVTELARCLVP
jgi:2-methylcitrate dehydratase PrpD